MAVEKMERTPQSFEPSEAEASPERAETMEQRPSPEDQLRKLEADIAEVAAGPVTPEAVGALQAARQAEADAGIREIEGALGEVSAESRARIQENVVNEPLRAATGQVEKLDALVEERSALETSSEIPEEKPVEEEPPPASMDRDPRYQQMLEAKSLQYLMTKDRKWFLENYSGKLSPDGYLLDKKGNETNVLPSQSVTAGFKEVSDLASSEFAQRFPDETAGYENAEKEAAQEKAGDAARKLEETPEAARAAIGELMADRKHPDYAKGAPAKETLSAEPFVSGNDVDQLLNEGQNLGLHRVRTESVVGSISPAYEDWSTEYDTRAGRIGEVAAELSGDDPNQYERVFQTNEKSQRIKVIRIAAPEGDLYMAKDGSHRIAGAKLAETPEVLADVYENEVPETATTKDSMQVDEWRKMIDAGLIEGQVTDNPDGSSTLDIKSQVLPWTFTSRKGMLEMSRAYQKAYPKGLENLKDVKGQPVPKEVFADDTGVALDFYLAGRWAEYKPQAQ